MRTLILSFLAVLTLAGCVAQELKMPWDRSAPVAEAPKQPQVKATPQPSPPKLAKPAPAAVPQKPSEPSVADVAAPAVKKVEKAAPVPAPVEAQPVVATPTEPPPAPLPAQQVVEPRPAAVVVAAEPTSAPTPAPDESQPASVPVDPMAEIREQARAVAQSGEAEVAEALWQLILQSVPDDAEAKEALAALEQAKLKEAKAEGKVILLGENAAGWVVQVATYRADGREQAFEWLGKIRRAGYKPFLKTVEFPGRTLYRLRLGAYPERWMAEEVERRLLNNFPNEGLRPRIMQQDD